MSFYNLYRDVISKNLCNDCGACMLVCPPKVIRFKETMISYEPQLTGECLGEKCSMCVEVCPGARIPRTAIEEKILGRVREDKGLESTQGVLESVYIAQWGNDEVLQASSSGGLVTGLLCYALERGFIDGAVVVGPSREEPWLSQSVVATSPKEIIAAAGSRYDSIPHLAGLQAALEAGLNKIAFVGLPCQVTALRKMQLAGRRYRKWTERIELLLGLWCIGTYSHHGIKLLIEQEVGIPLADVAGLKYRARPFPGQLTITTRSGRKQSQEMVRRPVWGINLARSFVPDSCQQCIDAQGDLADISFGDPWGHPIDQEALKTGIGFTAALVRSKKADDLLRRAEEDGRFRYFQEIRGEERNFLAKVPTVIHKCYGHWGFVEERKRHGLPFRDVQ